MTPENIAWALVGVAVTSLTIWGKEALKHAVRGRRAFDEVEKDSAPKKEEK